MAVTINIYYRGEHGSAKKFAQEMLSSGLVAAIRREEGNEGYDYFLPMDDLETVLLIDRWHDQQALDRHHASPMMTQIAQLREKYNLYMTVERYIDDVPVSANDEKYIRK